MRILGVIIIAFIPLILAFDIVNGKKMRILALREFERLCKLVKDEIRFNQREKQQILIQIRNDESFKNKLINSLYKGEGIFISVKMSALNNSGFNKQDIDVLFDFYKKLGSNDIEAQLCLCDYYGNLVKNRLKDAEDDLKQNGRLNFGLLACLSVFLFIFFC